MASALVLNEAEPRAKEIAAFAAKPENWYRLGESKWIPGDRPEHVLCSGTVRAVFSWTRVAHDDVRRHMSVSILGPNLPLPLVVWTLAHMFGFTDAEADDHGLVHKPAKTWAFAPDDAEHCIVVQQKVDLTPQPEAPTT